MSVEDRRKTQIASGHMIEYMSDQFLALGVEKNEMTVYEIATRSSAYNSSNLIILQN